MKVDFPEEALPARLVARKIIQAGGEAYLIGGAIRDLCLGKIPKDFDVATSFTPDQILQIYPGANETGKSFGVMRVRSRGHEVEVATFRLDGPYSDGRRPDYVEFTSLHEDIVRRDFTINALAANVETGEVIDHVDGLGDLSRKIVRAVGEPIARFNEDKLRLIRAIRFAHTLNFEIEPATWTALCATAAEIRTVAMERISEELTKTICKTPAARGIRLLDEAGLLEEILPEVTRLKGVDQPAQFHPEGDVYIHTCMLMDELHPDPSPAVAWAGLLHDIGKPDTFTVTDRIRFHGHAELGARMSKKIGRRFRLPNVVIDRIYIIIMEHQKFGDIDKMRPGRLARWASLPHFEELLEVHRADCAASHRDMSAYETALVVLDQIRALDRMPPKIVTGEVLIGMGLAAGPAFKEFIERAYEAQLEGAFTDPEGGRAFIRSLVGK